jgi:hypothetical protein
MQSVVGAGHALRRHPLDPLLASLALFDSPGDLGARIDALFNVRPRSIALVDEYFQFTSSLPHLNTPLFDTTSMSIYMYIAG